MKTLLLYDAFFSRGQSEKMNLEIAMILSADILTGVYTENTYIPEHIGFHGKIIEIYRSIPKNQNLFHTILLVWKFRKNHLIFQDYDTFILCDEGLSAASTLPEGKNTYYFAQNLPDYIEKISDEERGEIPYFFHEFYELKRWFLQKIFLSRIQKIKRIFTNTQENKAILRKLTGREDIFVFHPAVNTLEFHPVKQKQKYIFQEHNNITSVIENELDEYYLSVARLTSKKRVEEVVRAFSYLPLKNLVVLYREDDSQKDLCMSIARGHENIFFKKIIHDSEIPPMIANSVATISIAREDDFALSAIESMACGIPVIGVDEGGYSEVILPGKTGTLLKKEFNEYELIDAIRLMPRGRAEEMKEACIEKAREFSIENFAKELRKQI